MIARKLAACSEQLAVFRHCSSARCAAILWLQCGNAHRCSAWRLLCGGGGKRKSSRSAAQQQRRDAFRAGRCWSSGKVDEEVLRQQQGDADSSSTPSARALPSLGAPSSCGNVGRRGGHGFESSCARITFRSDAAEIMSNTKSQYLR